MSAILSLTPEERANAPRVRRHVGSGMYQLLIDPDWLRERALQEQATERDIAQAEARAVIERGRRNAKLGPWYRRATKEVERALSEPSEADPPIPARLMPRKLIADIAERHGLSPADLIGPSRVVKVCRARQHAAYELRRQTVLSTKRIGQFLGGRDHTTIIWAIKVWPAKAAALGIECLPLEGA